MNARVSISFLSDDSDADLLVNTQRIIDDMTEHEDFYVTPIPALAAVTAARGVFQTAVSGLDGRAGATGTRDEKRAILVDLLRELGAYVQLTSKGNAVRIIESGFPVQKARQSAGQLPQPQNARMRRPELSGQLEFRCDKVPNANSYQWRYATSASPAAWTMPDPTTTAKIMLLGLTPGTMYYGQVRAIGSAGPSEWSDLVQLMAV